MFLCLFFCLSEKKKPHLSLQGMQVNEGFFHRAGKKQIVWSQCLLSLPLTTILAEEGKVSAQAESSAGREEGG